MTMSLPPALSYQRQQLWMEEVPLEAILKDVGSPAYVYSRARLLENYRRFEEGYSWKGKFGNR